MWCSLYTLFKVDQGHALVLKRHQEDINTEGQFLNKFWYLDWLFPARSNPFDIWICYLRLEVILILGANLNWYDMQ
mgnify:CR=1 FL=1